MPSQNLSELEDTELYDLENAKEYEPERNFLFKKSIALGNKALDIGCGTGIVSNWLANKGVNITGIDLSEEMLTSAKAKRRAESCKYHLMDMRTFQLKETFPLVYLTGNTFMFLLTSADQQSFLQCVHDHLDSKGLLVFDTRPAKPSLQTLKDEDFYLVNETALDESLSMKLYYKTQYNPMTQEIKYDTKRDYFIGDNHEKTEYGDVTLKLTFPVELELLMKNCGFEIENIFSSFDEDPIDPEGGKFVYVCKKI